MNLKFKKKKFFNKMPIFYEFKIKKKKIFLIKCQFFYEFKI